MARAKTEAGPAQSVRDLSDLELQNVRAAGGRELAYLQDRKRTLSATVQAANVELRERQRKAKESGEYEVSDHAVVRYLERVLGYDVDAVRRKVAALAAKSKPLPGAPHRLKGGHKGIELVVSATREGRRAVMTVLAEPEIEALGHSEG